MSEIDPAGAEYEQVSERFHRVQSEFLHRDGYTPGVAGGHGADRPGIRQGRLAAADRGVQRRLADAHFAGQTAAGKAEHAAARRAHQPPRSGDAQLAGRLSEQLSVRLRSHLARPLLPRRDGEEDRGDMEQGRALLQRKLRQVSARQAAAARFAGRRLSQSARAHRAVGGVHQPLPLPGDQGQAGAEPHQGAGEDRAHRSARGREDDSLHLSAAQAQRAHRGRVQKRQQELWRKARAAQREFHHRARRAHCAGGRERRRKIHDDQDAGADRAPQPAASMRWDTTSGSITSRRISTRNWTPRRACWTT